MPAAPASHRGFTILELMTAIAVTGILLAIGVPSFNEIIRTNRTAAQVNELVTALNLARSEASKRGLPVSVCAANLAQNSCEGPGTVNWANGWLVFSDRIAPLGEVNASLYGDAILQSSHAVANQVQLTSTDGSVSYGAHGQRMSGADIILAVQPEQCSGENRRVITIIATGRAHLSKVACL